MADLPPFIQPIKLLAGSHPDTGTTGQGCFMNVVAYLNGEAQITDQSPCVCVSVRPLAIVLNDLGTNAQRQRLLPFVLRAIGSATEDRSVLDRRVDRLRQYGAECTAAIKSHCGPDAYDAYANAYAYASAYANAYANAKAYANANAYALRAELFEAGVRFLDDVLPPLDAPSGVVMERAARLCELAGAQP